MYYVPIIHIHEQNLQRPTEPGPVAVISPAESTVGDAGVSATSVAVTGPCIKSTSGAEPNMGAIDFPSGPGSMELKKKQDMAVCKEKDIMVKVIVYFTHKHTHTHT